MVGLYTVSFCRRRAEAAERQANGCFDPEARRHFEEIARLWREMLLKVFEAPKWRN
jgi:hypothetical protein